MPGPPEDLHKPCQNLTGQRATLVEPWGRIALPVRPTHTGGKAWLLALPRVVRPMAACFWIRIGYTTGYTLRPLFFLVLYLYIQCIQ